MNKYKFFDWRYYPPFSLVTLTDEYYTLLKEANALGAELVENADEETKIKLLSLFGKIDKLRIHEINDTYMRASKHK